MRSSILGSLALVSLFEAYYGLRLNWSAHGDREVPHVIEKNEDSIEPEVSARQPISNSALFWSVTVLTGWLTFELTAEPAVAAAVVCCRFGWSDVLAAIRLRRRPSDWGCGRAASWFCLASATMKIFLAACALLAIIAEVVVHLESRKPQPNPNALMPSAIWGPLFLAAWAIPVAALLALVGVISARIEEVRGGASD